MATKTTRQAPPRSSERLTLNGTGERLTHYLFRYPAKFHPPVVRELLERYTAEDDWVLDPFCGSGTLMVEAATLGRHSIGLDVDPVAVALAQAKTRRYQIPSLRASASRLRANLAKQQRPASEYERRMHQDLAERTYRSQAKTVAGWIPEIPNLFHWFRRYVVVDLARIRRSIDLLQVPETHRHLFRVVFASVIRNASNADPVPVSGLEVTAHMLRREKEGRLIDPFRLFNQALDRALDACEAFSEHADPGVQALVSRGDATALGRHLRTNIDAVITSPPYHGAVDYYRRHGLEMFWLGHTTSQRERLALLDSYVGRPKVPARHVFVRDTEVSTALAKNWESRIRKVSEERANAFRHYIVAMTRFFSGLAPRLQTNAPAVLVVGHSSWNNAKIPTTDLFEEIAGNYFTLDELLWYPVRNRYMSYTRHNGASISREYVLVFRKKQMRRRRS